MQFRLIVECAIVVQTTPKYVKTGATSIFSNAMVTSSAIGLFLMSAGYNIPHIYVAFFSCFRHGSVHSVTSI